MKDRISFSDLLEVQIRRSSVFTEPTVQSSYLIFRKLQSNFAINWWVSWSPFVGLFIARVSRGRTIREFILGTVLAPTLAAFVWFSVFGGTALHLEIMQGVPLAEAVKADVSTALFAMFHALPWGAVMSFVATLLVLVSGIAISLLLAGGVKAVQTATIVFALPFTGVILLMALALARGVKPAWEAEDRPDRALRRRMREMVGPPPQP